MSAFRIFVTLYTRKYPADAPALMKYGDVIQDLASRSHNWKFYDENFRFMRQSQPEAYPWGTVQWELWLRSQVTPQSSQSTPATQRGSKTPKYNAIPKGYSEREGVFRLRIQACVFQMQRKSRWAAMHFSSLKETNLSPIPSKATTFPHQ